MCSTPFYEVKKGRRGRFLELHKSMANLIRLYIEGPLRTGEAIDLVEGQAHYINNVMRLKMGDDVALFNGRDGEWRASIVQGRKKRCLLDVQEKLRDQVGCPDLWLVFAPIKKQRLDFIMEKATELGVVAFQPIITRRTVVSKIKTPRLQAQTIEAAEQCERLHIPEVYEALSLLQVMENWSAERHIFVLDERGGALPIQQALLNQGEALEKIGPCAILCGPEGGFDPSELDLLGKLPFVTRISVGPRILRADTAAIAAISCWQSVLGDWQKPLRERYEEE